MAIMAFAAGWLLCAASCPNAQPDLLRQLERAVIANLVVPSVVVAPP